MAGRITAGNTTATVVPVSSPWALTVTASWLRSRGVGGGQGDHQRVGGAVQGGHHGEEEQVAAQHGGSGEEIVALGHQKQEQRADRQQRPAEQQIGPGLSLGCHGAVHQPAGSQVGEHIQALDQNGVHAHKAAAPQAAQAADVGIVHVEVAVDHNGEEAKPQGAHQVPQEPLLFTDFFTSAQSAGQGNFFHRNPPPAEKQHLLLGTVSSILERETQSTQQKTDMCWDNGRLCHEHQKQQPLPENAGTAEGERCCACWHAGIF